MVKISKGDFIEIEYTGRLKEGGLVFDTTYEKLAKETGLYSPQQSYGPVVICLGEGQLIPGLEKEIEGKEIEEKKEEGKKEEGIKAEGKKEASKEFKIELMPEEAFGKKDAKLIRMIPFATFKRQKIIPEPGMQVNIDGVIGIIKTAAGGRCLVDFNHPLSGKEIAYTVKIDRIITDDKEKLKAYVSLALNAKDVPVELDEGKAIITTEKKLPKEIQEMLSGRIKELIPHIKDVSFSVKQKINKKKEDK